MSFTGNKLLTASQGNLPPLTWASTSIPTGSWNKVGYGNERFIVISGNNGNGNATAYSDDGINWVSGGTLPSTGRWDSIASGNGISIALNTTLTVSPRTARSIDNGVSWNSVSVPYWSGETGFVSGRSVGFGNGVFVIAGKRTLTFGDAANPFYYSSNGTTWNASTTTSPVNFDFRSIAFGNGRFVALQFDGSISYSDNNGTTWTGANALVSTPPSWSSITFGNGRFVATSITSNLVGYSFDGINWSTSTLPVSGTWSEVTFGNGRFVAIDTTGISTRTYNYAYSSNGINWNTGTIPPVNTEFDTIAFGEGKFVAIASTTTATYTL